MAAVNPLPPERADKTLQATYQQLTERFGYIPNFYATMARLPAALNQFVPLYTTIMNGGTINRYYTELAYLKASLGNTCAY